MKPQLLLLGVVFLGGCTLLFGDPLAGPTVPDGGSCPGACDAPPSTFCLDDLRLRAFATEGACADAACTYASYDVTCMVGCEAGACIGDDPCDGVMCTTPPARTCSGSHTLRSYAQGGLCAGGACSYLASESDCPLGCDFDHCVGDACAGVSCSQPPGPSCVDGNTRRSYGAQGTCSGGTCSYAPMDTNCPSGCQGGACKGDPCAGVSCDDPPWNACVGPTTLRSYAVGSCLGGTCSYTPVDGECPVPANSIAACSNAACAFTCKAGYKRQGNACVIGHDTWLTGASIGTRCFGNSPGQVAAVATNGKIYAFQSGKLEIYDPALDAWSQGGSAPAKQWRVAVAQPDGRIFLVADSVQAYDPTTGSYTVVAPAPPVDHKRVVGMSDGGLRAFGPTLGCSVLSGTTWTSTMNCTGPGDRGQPLVGALDGKVYALGGSWSFPAIYEDRVYSYDPGGTMWTQRASMSAERDEFAATVGLDGRIFALGGSNDSFRALSSVEAYSPSSNTWSTRQSLPAARNSIVAVTGRDGRIYVFGGSDGTNCADALYVYIP